MDELDDFKADYGNAGNEFTCYHDEGDKVIIKRVSEDDVVHSVVWPLLVFIVGSVVAILGYHEIIGVPTKHDADDDEEIIIGNNEARKHGITNKVGAQLDDESDAYEYDASHMDLRSEGVETPAIRVETPNSPQTEQCQSTDTKVEVL